jgi:hypothetical protein
MPKMTIQNVFPSLLKPSSITHKLFTVDTPEFVGGKIGMVCLLIWNVNRRVEGVLMEGWSGG